MFNIAALVRSRAQGGLGSSSVTSAMDGLSGNLPSAGSAPQSGIAGSAPEGIIAAGARVAQKQVGMRTPQPSIPMSESYNSAASRPVFNDRARSRAKSIFGDNNQRQTSVNGSCEK
jgi:hypothetical protein